MAKVTFVDHTGQSFETDVAVGESIMRGALYAGIEGITGECGGGLSCATCHCYVDDAWTDAAGGPSSEAETELLESAAAEVKTTSRLSCQMIMSDDLDGIVIHMPEHQF